ncbi:caspase family protein [Streptomyces sp. NPDC013455]|uniref:HD domain-containing protein n=1 Tax=Streptomyces sp. NPDC013455 TaxID=3155605 RepID=UPI0033D2416E
MDAEQPETRAGGSRRALVVGVGRTPALGRDEDLAARFPELACASEDVDLVGRALRQSRYEVRQLSDPGLSELLGALQEFFDQCLPGDIAFLYLSCHGVTLNGRDHLLPADAQPGRAAPDGSRSLLDRTLIPADPEGLLLGLPAGVTAVVCLDTCRTEEPTATSQDGRRTVLTAAEDVYWLYSCGQGERSYADPQEGSWFGRALAKALTPTTQPTTFADLVGYTRSAVRRAASDAGIRPPTIDRYVPHGRKEDVPGPVLCDGAQEAYRWTTMIDQSSLWRYTSGGDVAHERVRKRLGALVEHIVDSLSTEGAHRADPWADPTYPVRVVGQLEALVERARLEGRDLLSPAETAALLAAPVVHEGVVAIALEELRLTLPGGMDAKGADHENLDGHDRLVRDAAHDVCRAHSQVRRTAATLRRRGLVEQTAAADHWLRHRFITEWDLLWERTGDYPGVDTIIGLLVNALLDASSEPCTVTDTTRLAIDGQLRQVLGHLAVHPSSSPRINDVRGGDEWNCYPPVRGNHWRAQDLARLLWTAGLLAADPRRMSSVLVDHLGAHEPLDPAEVVAAVSADFGYDVIPLAEQDTGPYELAARFPCPHPALHVAVEELAARANGTVGLLHLEWQKQRTSPPALLRGFPERVTSEQLVPLDERYKQPLERFRLAEDEIRPLLMGTQLYGDRMLAVRELYQNALDACRYRSMRRQYGATQGRQGPEWQPRIRFTQGWDADGRLYIECTDNGSGMSRAKLTSMFARAGKRYEQDPEFVQERRNWRRAGLSEMPLNSRFGIGVFSYFMLAEEVVVWTSPVDHYGRAVQVEPLRADIQSGSGLLRIGDDPAVALDGGTRVRLYLGEEETQPPSLVDTLESFLWVADFEVEAEELPREGAGGAARQARWEPGELNAPTPKPWKYEAVQGSSDIWLVQGKGRWLLDGVVIKDAESVPGRIVNLRERHRPEPSVDRNTLISHDRDAVTAEVLDAIPRAAARWTHVALDWLWELVDTSPRVAVEVLDALPPETLAVIDAPNSSRRSLPRSLPLSEVGCLPTDKSGDNSRTQWRTFREHEGLLLNMWRQTRLGLQEHAHRFCPDGYPRPRSMDAMLFRQDLDPRGWETVVRAACLTHVPVSEPLKALRRYAIVGFGVPGTADIRKLRGVRPSAPVMELLNAYRETRLFGDASPTRPALHAPLLLIAAEHRLSLGDAAVLLEELRAWQPELPDVPELDPELAAETPSRLDAALLVREPGTAARFHRGELRLIDLLTRADRRVSIGDLAARVRHFAPLGFSLRQEPSPAVLEHGPLSAAEQVLFSATSPNALRNWRHADMSTADVLLLSADLGVVPAAVAAQINGLAQVTGIRAQEPPAAVADRLPPPLAATVLRRVPTRQREGIGPWEFIRVVTRAPKPRSQRHQATVDPGAAEEALRYLDAAGLLSPGFEGLIPPTLRQLSAGHPLLQMSSFSPPPRLDETGLTPQELLRLSADDKCTIGETLARLSQAEQFLPVHIPACAPEVTALSPTLEDYWALTHRDGFRAELTILPLLEHARHSRRPLAASIERLAAFTPLGAARPPCDLTDPGTSVLREFTPTLFDLAAFDAGLLGPGLLGPLELVRTAGRFGWSLGKTYDRYAPLACLGLDVTVPRPGAGAADRVPDWQDLIILTEQLTGRAPALTGAVSLDHIALCAEETDLPASEVRERLVRYATLFSLNLPALEGTPG